VDLPPERPDGCLHVFMAAKAGGGVTTIASNFAVALAEESGQSTILIDFNLPLGDAAINLGVKAKYTTVDAIQNIVRLDPHFLSTLVVKHSSGLSVLAAPTELNPYVAVADDMDRVLRVALKSFDHVVVDVGSRLDLLHRVLFDARATIYLVLQLGIPELRNANRVATHLGEPGSPRLQIVINRYDPNSKEFPEEHIQKALTRDADWKIPNCYAAVRKMQNTATTLVSENSPVAHAIRRMARKACGKPDAVEAKKGFRLFGGAAA